jgi:hypothetical protein
MSRRLTYALKALRGIEESHASAISMSTVDLRIVGIYWRLLNLKRARVARLMLAAS